MAVAYEQHIGSRTAQEDALTVVYEREGDSSGDLLMLVADGMGGHVGGATASNLVVQAFRSAFLAQSPKSPPKERLQEALTLANAALKREVAANPSLKGMGTTLIAAWKHGDGLLWLSVGDSPLYLYRAGQVRRLNQDHSFFGELMEKVQQGRLTLAEAKAHPKRNALRSALTGGEVRLVDLNHVRLEVNDTLVVATDGLDTLEPDALRQVLEAYHRSSPAAMCQKLITATIDCGNPKQDNVSLVTYMHGAEDRTVVAQSKWTRVSLGGSVLKNWQVVSLGVVAMLLIVIIGIMLVLSQSKTPPPMPEPISPAETTPAPTEETSSQEEPIEGPTAPPKEESAPLDDAAQSTQLPQQDASAVGVAASMADPSPSEATNE